MQIDSATPPSGFAQNDSIVGEVQGTFQNEGRAKFSLYLNQLMVLKGKILMKNMNKLLQIELIQNLTCKKMVG